MSELNELKLKDVEDLNGINPMSSNADGGGGSAIDGGEKDEVVITGKKDSGNGGGNSAATCRKCGREYDGHGLCPVCDYPSGSGSGSTSGSGFGSGYGIGSGLEIKVPCKSDECKKNSDCGPNRACYTQNCGLLNAWSYKKCRDMDDNEKSCVGKKLCDKCTLFKTYGTAVGECSQTAFGPALFCFDTCIS